MKNARKFLIVMVVALGLCSCSSERGKQNPNFKLTQEQGTMLKLITNLAPTNKYHNWAIEFPDQRLQNYISTVYLDDATTKHVSKVSICQQLYTNDLLTDAYFYEYDGTQTIKDDYEVHIRWTNTTIYVEDGPRKYEYTLDNDSLTTKCDDSRIFASYIKKIDDGLYEYLQHPVNVFENGTETKYNGVNYLRFKEVDGFKIMDVENRDHEVYKSYKNGLLTFDNQFRKTYDIGFDTLSEGSLIWYDSEDKKHEENLTRIFDNNGKLLVETEITEKNEAVISWISFNLPEPSTYSKDFSTPIDIPSRLE